jgi:hypothetical protein
MTWGIGWGWLWMALLVVLVVLVTWMVLRIARPGTEEGSTARKLRS